MNTFNKIMNILKKNRSGVLFIIVVLVLYFIAISRCDLENSENTDSVTGVIENVEYFSPNRVVMFDVSDMYFYIGLKGPHKESEIFYQLEKDKTEVTIVYNNEIDARRPYFLKFAENNVVDLRTENRVYYDIDDYNKCQVQWFIVYTCLMAIFVLFAVIFTFIDEIVDFLLKKLDKKYGKKRKRK